MTCSAILVYWIWGYFSKARSEAVEGQILISDINQFIYFVCQITD